MGKKIGAPAPVYVAVVGITSDAGGLRVEPGEAVPGELLKEAPWLLEQGYVTLASEPATQAGAQGDETGEPSPATQTAPAPASEAPSEPSEQVAPVALEEAPAEPVDGVELEAEG